MTILRGVLVEMGVGAEYVRPRYDHERVVVFQNKEIITDAPMQADGSFELHLPDQVHGLIELRATFPHGAPTEIDIDPEAAEVEIGLIVAPQGPRFA